MKNKFINKVKTSSLLMLLMTLLVLSGCADPEEGWADERYLTNFEYSVYHTNPITGEDYTAEELEGLSYDPKIEEHYFEGQIVEITFVSQKKPSEVKLLAGNDLSLIFSFTSFVEAGEGYESEKFSSSLEDLGFIEDGDKGTIQVKAEFEDGSIGTVDFKIKRIAEKIETFVFLKTRAGETIPLRIDENVTSRTPDPEYGNIVVFDGSSNKVEITDNTALEFRHAEDYSIGFYINTTSPDSDPVIIGDQNWASSGNPGLTIAHRGSNWRVARADGATKADIDFDGAYNDGDWHHLMVTFDRVGAMTMYQDGVSVANTDMSAVGATDSGANLFIGQDGTGNYGQYFQGQLSDVYIYDYALTAEEVTQIVGEKAGPPTGVQLKTQDGFVKNLEVLNNGAAESTEEDRFTFTFEGGTNVEILEDLDFVATDDFSFSFWTKYNDMSSDPCFLGNKDWGSGGNQGFCLAYTGDTMKMNTAGSDSSSRTDFSSTTPTNDGEWHFVAVTLDRDGSGIIYIDGTSNGSIDISAVDNLDAGMPWRIGNDGTGFYTDWIGKISDVVIYDYVVSAEEIAIIKDAVPPTGVQLKTESGLVRNLEVSNSGATESIEEDRFTFTFEGGTNVEILNDLGFVATNDFSYSFWTKYGDMDSDPCFMGNKDWASGGNQGFCLAYTGSNMKLNMAGSDSSSRSDISTISSTNDGEWHLVVVSMDRDGSATIYIDGASEGSIDISAVDNLDPGMPWRIGNEGTGTYNDWIGKISDVVIYNYVISVEEISDLLN